MLTSPRVCEGEEAKGPAREEFWTSSSKTDEPGAKQLRKRGRQKKKPLFLRKDSSGSLKQKSTSIFYWSRLFAIGTASSDSGWTGGRRGRV